MKKIALVLAFVMLFTMSEASFADYRTGSATGDAIVYGTGGGILAGLGAWGIAAIGIACPPVGICAGFGALGLGVYGAVDSNKTAGKDAAAVVTATVGVPLVVTGMGEEAARELLNNAKGVAIKGANVVVPLAVGRAVQVCAEEWKNPSESTKFEDWPY